MTTNITADHRAAFEALTSGDYAQFRFVLVLRERRTGEPPLSPSIGTATSMRHPAIRQRHAVARPTMTGSLPAKRRHKRRCACAFRARSGRVLCLSAFAGSAADSMLEGRDGGIRFRYVASVGEAHAASYPDCGDLDRRRRVRSGCCRAAR
jgi:hypothetical protein